MDLSSIMNDDGRERGPAQPRPTQSHVPSATPSTPGQSLPPRSSFMSAAAHPSPSRQPSQDYATPYAASPPQYPQPMPYSVRPPAPHPIHPPSQADPRSPSAAIPTHSPYRQTPTTSFHVAAGYPFPGPPASPSQRHMSMHAPALPSTENIPQQSSQVPPVGTPGSAPQYYHQRSQSTSTPTSAQSQHQHGQPFLQGSPVAPSSDYGRQQSQPPTPLGPPLSSGSRPFKSVYSARPPHMDASYDPSQQSVGAPSPSVPSPSIPRPSSSDSVPDFHPAPDRHRPQSHYSTERDRTASLSPRTRVPSLPSSAGHPMSDGRISDTRHIPAPAKRKLDDRDLASDDLEKREPQRLAVDTNGTRVSSHLVPQKPKRYAQPPVWSLDSTNRPLRHPNFSLKTHGPPSVNGKPASRHNSPEAARGASSGPSVAGPPVGHSATTPRGTGPHPGEQERQPWESSFTGTTPSARYVPRAVADHLFLNVVDPPHFGEITSRGIQFEIEAKLGILIDPESGVRIDRGVGCETIMASRHLRFESDMDEAYHKDLNEVLNTMVVETHPNNAARMMPPAQPIQYKHRREVDKFYELPQSLRDRLPPIILSHTQHRPPKLRVTRDQKTQEVLAAIVKVSVSTLHIHIPTTPLDCRISVNLEMPWEGDLEEVEQLANPGDRAFERVKDRLSYKQGCFQVDLTQVTRSAPGPSNLPHIPPRVSKTHEVELEVDPGAVITCGRQALNGDSKSYLGLVEAYVENVLGLADRVAEFEKQRS